MSRKTVLVVDNEKLLSELLGYALESEECQVSTAASVAEAANLLRSDPPDLALINPELSGGLDLLGSAILQGVGVIALTGTQEMRDTVRRLQIDAIRKDASLSTVVHKVRKHLDLHRLPKTTRESVLVVDDNVDIRKALSNCLETHNYLVTSVGTGSEALEVLERDLSVALLLLDVRMPDMGGLDVLSRVMRRSKPPVVIMLSGVSDQEIARHSMELGAFDYIVKPADVLRIEAAVSAGLSHARYRSASLWQKVLRKGAS